MRTYRNVWAVTVTVLSAVAFAAALGTLGWIAAVVVPIATTSVGAAVGMVWYEEPEARRRATVRFALWAGLAGIVMLGFTPLIRQWSLLLLFVVVVLAPDTLLQGMAFRAVHRRPVAVLDTPDRTYRALERRWRTTTWQVRSRSLPMADRLQLVLQREWLLDELERRDPGRFEDTLVRDGWREPQQT